MDNIVQMRYIRKYARSLGVNAEQGALLWCTNGLALQWRNYHS